jgi:HK97 family phage major capsid protein
LVQQEYSDFVDLLRGESIYARIPSRNALLGRNGSLLFPGLTTDASGDFVGEGAPIPCVEGVFNISEAKPYKLGVLTIQTAELMMRSDPSSDMEIRNSMVEGTAVVLDAKFTDAEVAVAGVRPAGLQTFDAVPVTSGGVTQALIDADLKTVTGNMIGRNMNSSLVWLIPSVRINSLRYITDGNGNYPYRDQVNAGVLGGYPFLDSTRQPDDIVMLVHTNSLYKLIEGSIDIQASADATIHTSTTPEQIISGGAIPAIPAEGNVRSMFQENSVATRLIMPAAWHVARAGAVEVIDTVAW